MTSPYAQPPQGYPGQPAQPNYAPQQAPGYPAQPQAPQYAPPFDQQYAQNQFGQPQAPQYAPPQAPVPPAPVQGPPVGLTDFMTQPAGGGNSLTFERIGITYSGTVVRTVSGADVERATEMGDRNKIAKYSDGREKLILKLPLLLDQPTPQYPDGTATWILKSSDRNELFRAMEAAGAKMDPELGFFRPTAGDHIVVTYTHDQPSRNGMNPRKVKRVEYVVGNGIPPQLPQGGQAQQQYQGPPVGAFGQPLPPAQPYYGQPPQAQPAGPYYGQPPTNVNVTPGYAPLPQPPQAPQGAFYDPAQAQAAAAYQQATGQPMQPQQYMGPAVGQPGYPEYAGYAQQAPPTPAAAPPAIPGYGPGAQPTAPASPSEVPPGWPADVPFRAGLTVEQARLAAVHGIPAP